MAGRKLNRSQLLGAALIAMSNACVPQYDHPVLVLHPQGVDSAATTLRVATVLDDRSGLSPNDFTSGFAELDLELPLSGSGHVRVDVRALAADNKVLGRGSRELDISGNGRYELTVPIGPIVATIEALEMQSPRGGWWTYNTSIACGLGHLFVVEGTDPEGPLANPPGADLLIPLSAGTYSFVLLGDYQDVLPFTGEVFFAEVRPANALRSSTDSPRASLSIDQTDITVLSFTRESSNMDRVGSCSPYPDAQLDTIARMTLEVSSASQ